MGESKRMISYVATSLVSLVGATAFAIASGQSWRTAIAIGVGVSCTSITCHRFIKALGNDIKGVT